MKIILFVFNIFILNNFIYSQILKSIQIDFEKYFEDKNVKELIRGTVYYQASENLVISVREPVNQWMISEENKLIIYYPEKKQAFQFTTQTPASFPFFQAFLGAIKEDYGLTDMGYSLAEHEINGDTLITGWNPPKNASNELGDFTLTYVSNKITYAELRKADGSIISKSFYKNHFKYGVNYFPLEISTIRYADADSSFEKITYSNPQFNINLPEIVVNFELPPDTEIEEIRW